LATPVLWEQFAPVSPHDGWSSDQSPEPKGAFTTEHETSADPDTRGRFFDEKGDGKNGRVEEARDDHQCRGNSFCSAHGLRL
jgi:hypothetical protein